MNVVDTTAPVVTRVGSGTVNMTQSGVFVDNGATWSDAVDGTGTVGSFNSGSLNVNTAGTYVIGYVYVDASGNTGSVNRVVNVIAPDLTAPVISLVGSGVVNVEYAGSFVDPGATWTDNVDGTGSISSFTNGSINVNAIGSYVVSYVHVDVAGNTGSVSRTVNVVDTTAPVASIIYSSTGLTNGSVVATLTGASEPITITNNSGAATRTFNTNGSFTFIFTDIS